MFLESCLMPNEQSILETLDNVHHQGPYNSFLELGHPYSCLIDCRLNILRSKDGERWAIVTERLGYCPRGAGIELEISYFGNCLKNLESCNDQATNNYLVYPVEQEQYNLTIDGEALKSDADYWLVRDQRLPLSVNEEDYVQAGIQLKRFEPDEIGVEEAGRLLVQQHRDLFRATDAELYKSIPSDLDKILVLDEWHHKDFAQVFMPEISEEQAAASYQLMKSLLKEACKEMPDLENYMASLEQGTEQQQGANEQSWEENRPGSYETWQQLARVIATGDNSHYNPSLPPNTHWKNWPESGSL